MQGCLRVSRLKMAVLFLVLKSTCGLGIDLTVSILVLSLSSWSTLIYINNHNLTAWLNRYKMQGLFLQTTATFASVSGLKSLILPTVRYWSQSQALWSWSWHFRPSVADWGGMSAGCSMGPVVCWSRQWMVRHGIISSCQSAATSEIVKCFWSRVLTHISSTVASTRRLLLPLFTSLTALIRLRHMVLYRCVLIDCKDWLIDSLIHWFIDYSGIVTGGTGQSPQAAPVKGRHIGVSKKFCFVVQCTKKNSTKKVQKIIPAYCFSLPQLKLESYFMQSVWNMILFLAV